MSEAQKYQGALYRPDKDNQNGKGKKNKRKSMNGYTNSQAMVPRGAYVEDAPEGDDMNAVAVIDVPPRAPTPPPAPEGLPENINVFDFLVTDATPKGAVQPPPPRRMVGNGESQYSQYSQYSNGDGSRYIQHGYSYGNAPIEPSLDRFDSWNNLGESQQSNAFVTPAPKERRKEKKEKYTVEKSDKKRKRNVEELDISSAKRPMSRDEPMSNAPATGGRTLHSGLTGGLSRLVTDSEFYDDRIEAGPTPISPLKRSKREKDAKSGAKEERRKSSYVSYSTTKAPSSKHSDEKYRRRSRSPDRERRRDKPSKSSRRDSFSSEDRSHVSRRKQIDYPDRPSSVQPSSTNQMVSYNSRADLFLSFITKGPDSERGCSINKALKRYHRERETRHDEKEEDDKELWKALRLRRNSRGEIVLFSS